MKLLILAFFIIFSFSTNSYATAPEYGSEDWQILSPYSDWMERMHADGKICCHIGDGRPVEARINKNGHYEVYITNQKFGPIWLTDNEGHRGIRVNIIDHWEEVPENTIIRNEFNPTGVDIAWVINGQIRCFIKASEG